MARASLATPTNLQSNDPDCVFLYQKNLGPNLCSTKTLHLYYITTRIPHL